MKSLPLKGCICKMDVAVILKQKGMTRSKYLDVINSLPENR